jgi:hypothetical protein
MAYLSRRNVLAPFAGGQVVAGSNPVSPTFENLLGFNPNVDT